jgi:hypothetical protein
VIAGERADQPARELPTEGDFEPVPRLRLCVRENGHAGAVVEKAADGFSVVGRQCVHGPLSIVLRRGPDDP